VALGGRAVQLMRRVGLESDFALAGGMTQNAAMVKALEAKLGNPLNLPPHGLGQLNGAFGAAPLGLRRMEKLLAEGRAIPAPGAETAEGTQAQRRWSTFVSPQNKVQAASAGRSPALAQKDVEAG
jgi:hypothetical protein